MKILAILFYLYFFVLVVKSPPPPMDEGSSACDGTCGDTLDSEYSETIDGDYITITSNGIPSHEYNHDITNQNPNEVCVNQVEVTLPINPTKLDTPLATDMGVIGILKTGGFLFNHLSSPTGVDDVANHVNNELLTLDGCHGHASPDCEYHYHEISITHACQADDQWDSCEHIGYMLDGYKIYSHCLKTDGEYLKSCYVLTTDEDGDDTTDYTYTSSADCDLDEANGYDFTEEGITDNNGDEITGYAYVASESYPYVMAYTYATPVALTYVESESEESEEESEESEESDDTDDEEDGENSSYRMSMSLTILGIVINAIFM